MDATQSPPRAQSAAQSLDAVSPAQAAAQAGLFDPDDGLAARFEDAGLSCAQPPQQTIYDGWLLRWSPGKAKRAKSVNAISGGRLPLARKFEHVERFYAQRGLAPIYRLTPFSQPSELDGALHAAGYVAFDHTRVMGLDLSARAAVVAPGCVPVSVDVATFSRAAAALRDSPATEADAEAQRLAFTTVPAHYLVLEDGDAPIACGSIMIDDDVAGIFNMVTAPAQRGRGWATALVDALLVHAVARGARHAYLQVDAGNEAARRVYRRFGFADRYAYWYRAPRDRSSGA